MKKIVLFSFLAFATLSQGTLFAQDKVKFSKEELRVMDDYLFNEMFDGVSSKKNSVVILKDGTKVEGSASGIKRKKRQIQSITIKEANGKKNEYKAEDIEEMYLPIPGILKATKMSNYFGNINNASRKSLSKTINKDEVYVKNVSASLKNKKTEEEFLMQLINPDFSHVIEVYADPVAGETASISVMGSPGLGGGVTKSYYVKKGDEVIWLKKGEFKENYDFLFADNQEFMAKYPYNSIKWEHLSYLIAEYTKLSAID